jgi:hypothetical protein
MAIKKKLAHCRKFIWASGKAEPLGANSFRMPGYFYTLIQSTDFSIDAAQWDQNVLSRSLLP